MKLDLLSRDRHCRRSGCLGDYPGSVVDPRPADRLAARRASQDRP